jgi:hypothetical protein
MQSGDMGRNVARICFLLLKSNILVRADVLEAYRYQLLGFYPTCYSRAILVSFKLWNMNVVYADLHARA